MMLVVTGANGRFLVRDQEKGEDQQPLGVFATVDEALWFAKQLAGKEAVSGQEVKHLDGTFMAREIIDRERRRIAPVLMRYGWHTNGCPCLTHGPDPSVRSERTDKTCTCGWHALKVELELNS